MKIAIFALALAASFGATAIPAFAKKGMDSANSLPSGFYTHTPKQVQAQIKQNYFAAQQAKHVANDASAKALSHIV
jgi:hypothetical protein